MRYLMWYVNNFIRSLHATIYFLCLSWHMVIIHKNFSICALNGSYYVYQFILNFFISWFRYCVIILYYTYFQYMCDGYIWVSLPGINFHLKTIYIVTSWWLLRVTTSKFFFAELKLMDFFEYELFSIKITHINLKNYNKIVLNDPVTERVK